jgi:hypothetical protein
MRLLEELELRCQAACMGLHGYAKVARHEVIANKFEAIGRCQDELEKLIGPEEANRTVVLTYIRVMDGGVAETSVDQREKNQTCEIGSVSKHLIQREKEC